MTRPTAFAVLSLFFRTALRRFFNRSAYWRERRKAKGSPEAAGRTATLPRSSRQSLVGRLFAKWLPITCIFGALILCVGAANNLVDCYRLRQIQSGEKISLWPEQYTALQQAAQWGDGPERTAALDRIFTSLVGVENGMLAKIAAPVARQRWTDAGLEGFQRVTPAESWRGELAILSRESRRGALRAVGFFLLFINLAATGMGLGLMNKSVAGDESQLAWLFQFPVAKSLLFACKLVEYMFDMPLVLINGVLAAVFLGQSGCGFWAGLGLAIAFGLATACASAAIRLGLEVVLLQKASRKTRATIVSLAFGLGNLGLLVVVACGNSATLLGWSCDLANVLPEGFFWNVFSLGFGTTAMIEGLATGWWIAAPVMAAGMAIGAVVLAARLTVRGLASNLDSGRRPLKKTTRVAATGRQWFRGIVWKELLQLRRQPQYAVQILFAPVIIGMLVFTSAPEGLMSVATRDAAALSTTIFVGLVYLLVLAANQTLASELKTLWFLQCQPRSLADSIRDKARVWGAIAVALAVTLATAAVSWHPAGAIAFCWRMPFLLISLALLAEILFGSLALAATIVNERTVRFRRSAIVLPLLIGADVAAAIHAGEIWHQIGLLTILFLLAAAVRQKQHDELAWLSEPTAAPPKRLHALHGLIAIFAFLFFRDALKPILLRAGLDAELTLSAAFAASAAGVAVISWIWLRRNGLKLFAPGAGRPVLRPMVAGLLATCSTAVALVALLRHIAPGAGLARFVWNSQSTIDAANLPALLMVAAVVLVAPVCEEWMFRGLLFQSLRRSRGVWVGVALSSLFFATLHPAVSLVGVLVLGVTAALVVEKTQRLWPAMVVHMVYNAVVIAMWNLPG